VTSSEEKVEPSTRDNAQQPAAEHRDLMRGFLRSVTTANTVWVSVLAIVAAFVLGALLIVFSDTSVLHKFSYFTARPGDALSAAWHDISSAYSAMFKGAIVNPQSVTNAANGTGTWSNVFNPISETIVNSTPLALASLGVAFGFRGGLFNIGAQGQMIAGGICAGWVGFSLHGWPFPIPLLLALLAGYVAGAVWGGSAGYLRARTGAHEVITTIMLNYIAVELTFYLLNNAHFQRPGRTDTISRIVDTSARLPHLAGSALRLNAGVIVALLAAAAVWWILYRSTYGFEVRAIGLNPDAARANGMNVERTYTSTMSLAGGLAGLAGATVILGTQYSISPGFEGSVGFDAITVALLGRSTPVGALLGALLFGALRAGGISMQAQTQIPVDIVTVIQSLTVLFIAAPAVIRTVFRLREGRAESPQVMAKGLSS
jgi:simple sugar transport system permease protein